MPELIDDDDADRSYDVAVYVLELDYQDTRPEIDQKFLAKRQSLEDREPLYSVPGELIVPGDDDSHTGVEKWIVTNEDGTVTYPLYQELASEARRVYYVGQGARLYTRVKQQLQPSRDTKFLRNADVSRLVDVRYFSVDMDAEWLLEALEAELRVELAGNPERGSELKAEFQQMAEMIRGRENVSFHNVKEWKSEARSFDHSSFVALDSYHERVRQLRKQKEKNVATEYVKLWADSVDRGVQPGNVRSYAYWM